MQRGQDGRGQIGLKTYDPTVQIAVPASKEYVNIVCLAVYGIASKMGFSYEEIEDLKVAVSEAFTSSVHKYAADDKIVVGFDKRMDALRISVKEEGERYKLQPVPTNLAPRAEMIEQKGGLGFYLMQALVDEVVVRTEWGTEFILMKYYNRSEQTS